MLLAFLAQAQQATALPTGITGYSGKQGFGGCEFCHGGAAPPAVRFEGPEEVAGGAVATFRFVVESSEQVSAGFNVAATGGTLDGLAEEGVRAADGELTQEAPKPFAGGEASWEFTWRAPTRTGPQQLYGSGLSSDGKDNKSGDGTATTTLVLTVTEGASCMGDCDGDNVVAINELIVGVNLALEDGGVGSCPAFDGDESESVTIDELVTAVGMALNGCDFEPTPTTSPGLCPEPTPAVAEALRAGTLAEETTAASPLTTIDSPGEGSVVEWTTYGGSHLRTFLNADESRIGRENVGTLRPKWRYKTGAVITAAPSVAYVDVPGEGRTKVVFVTSWDGNLYALRASNGTQLWHYRMKPHPGATFPQASSVEVAMVAGEQRIYVGGGMTMYCLEAATGAPRWEFDVGTGCTTCDGRTERNEIESSPAVVGDVVYFGMDINDSAPGKGGAYAVSAVDGRLIWYFDVVTRKTCRPHPADVVRRFDGFHTAAQLGLPEDFFATRPGCDFDRTEVACGNIWSSFAVDATRRMIFTASSNCDTDDDPDTAEPLPPMPPYDEAIFALTFDGDPVWAWRPREVDNADLAFGGVPNLFEIEIQGVSREVVGIGNKDGTYYLLDRDGVNEITGVVEPYWQTRVVEGGAIGGIIASAAVGVGKVFFSTAVGWSLSAPQKPSAWGLRANDGAHAWWNCSAGPSFGPTSATPSVVFMGSLFAGRLFGYDADTGEQLFQSPLLGGPVASGAVIVDGEVFVGAGIGARGGYEQEPAYLQSLVPSPVTAFCLPDASDCPAELCDDGDPCTYDFHGAQGCQTEPAPDGIACRVGSQAGSCQSAVCRVGEATR